MLGYSEGLKTSYKKNLTEFLKAANEIKQSYKEKFDTNTSGRAIGLKADTELFSSNSEELVLFPTYTKRHRKVDPAANSSYHSSGLFKNSSSEVQNEPSVLAPNSAREDPGIERNKAIVDVDIQGWLYSPHNGRLSRKQKLLLTLARQLGGLPASGVPSDDRALEPKSITLQYENTNINFEEERLSQETEQLFQGVGKKNTNSEKDLEAKKFGFHAGGISENIQHFRSIYSNYFEDEDSTHLVKKNSLNTAGMSQAELAVANSNLMARIGPFLSTPIVSSMISIFFYNDVKSVERTVRTNEVGHFMIRESLDFIPAHIRVLAMENLSATEKVTIIEPKGVSLISDIDDTIKRTLINSGAREVFRNSFIKDLKDLEIDGVREWYNLMYDMGVEFHYVSNSPWQLFPTLSKFFNYVGMPPGSCHLKNYTSVLQGIFEPVSERKKPTITNILSDFPERYFILVGDSGEADLEVYCDVVLANPGRILMVLIRNLNQNFSDPTVNSSTDDFHNKESLVPKNSPLESVFDSEKISGKQSDISESSLKSCNGQNIDIPTLLGGAHEFTEKQDNLQDLTRDTCSDVKNFQFLNDSKSEIKGKRPPPPRPYKPTALRSQYPTQNPTVTQFIDQKVSLNYNTKSKSPDVPLYDTQYLLRQNRSSKRAIVSVRSHDTFKDPEDPVTCISLHGNNHDPVESNQNLTLRPLHTSHSSLSPLPFNGDKSKVKESITNRFSWGGLASSFDAENNRSEGNLRNKKIEVWRNRWKRAEQILNSQGVKLREWRVGSDVCLETVQVIEKKLTQINEEPDNSHKM